MRGPSYLPRKRTSASSRLNPSLRHAGDRLRPGRQSGNGVGLDGARPTGVHFAEQSVDSICGAVDLFEQNLDRFTVSACVDNARRFSRETFVAKMRAVIDRALRAH